MGNISYRSFGEAYDCYHLRFGQDGNRESEACERSRHRHLGPRCCCRTSISTKFVVVSLADTLARLSNLSNWVRPAALAGSRGLNLIGQIHLLLLRQISQRSEFDLLARTEHIKSYQIGLIAKRRASWDGTSIRRLDPCHGQLHFVSRNRYQQQRVAINNKLSFWTSRWRSMRS